jgi:hypothetical protein
MTTMPAMPAMNSATALVAACLPFDAIVEALMTEVGVTRAEATKAAFAAGDASRIATGVSHARA